MSKKFAAIAITAGVALTASAAFAYWTTTGSGSGSATVGSGAANAVTVTATVASGIVPGGTAAVSFKAANPGPTDLYVGTIHLVSIGVAAADTAHSTCDTSYFGMIDVTSDTPVPQGSTALSIAGAGTLTYANDPAVSQDSCKGATLALVLSNN